MSIRGFTLIELMVTIGIMILITSISLSNYSQFGGKILLRTTAYELALAFREAQTYGISVHNISIDTGKFQSAYGLHFDASEPTEYIMFTDTYKDVGAIVRGEDGLRNTPLEDVTIYNIGKGYKINQICASDSCVSVCTSCTGSLDVTFKRPEPDASIRFAGVSNNIYDKAKIELISPKGDVVSILVEVSGQVSIVK